VLLSGVPLEDLFLEMLVNLIVLLSVHLALPALLRLLLLVRAHHPLLLLDRGTDSLLVKLGLLSITLNLLLHVFPDGGQLLFFLSALIQVLLMHLNVALLTLCELLRHLVQPPLPLALRVLRGEVPS
jgi:hypothetical protein